MCVSDAPNKGRSFADAQTGTSANNYFRLNTTQHNSQVTTPHSLEVVVVMVVVVMVVEVEVGGRGWGL